MQICEEHIECELDFRRNDLEDIFFSNYTSRAGRDPYMPVSKMGPQNFNPNQEAYIFPVLN
jgi:hypothetical protein